MIKKYNNNIRFDLFELENAVNDIKIMIWKETWMKKRFLS